jgi:hypothetical protein
MLHLATTTMIIKTAAPRGAGAWSRLRKIG